MRILATGIIHQKPVSKTAVNGNTYTKAILKEIKGDQTAWLNLTAFGSNGATLAEVEAGEGLSIAGEATVSLYEPEGRPPRPSISVTVEQVITLRKPKPKANMAKAPPADVRGSKFTHVSTPEPEPEPEQKMTMVTGELLATAKAKKEAEKSPPKTSGTCQQCGVQLIEGLCPQCPF